MSGNKSLKQMTSALGTNKSQINHLWLSPAFSDILIYLDKKRKEQLEVMIILYLLTKYVYCTMQLWICMHFWQ